MIAASGHPRMNAGHLDTAHLQAEADRLGKPLQVRAIPGHLLLVLPVGADMELTADYCVMGDIGDSPREVEFEPLTAPATEPITVPAPTDPVRVPEEVPA